VLTCLDGVSRRCESEVLAIYNTMLSVFEIATSERIPTYKAADRLAERRLRGETSIAGRVENAPSLEV